MAQPDPVHVVQQQLAFVSARGRRHQCKRDPTSLEIGRSEGRFHRSAGAGNLHPVLPCGRDRFADAAFAQVPGMVVRKRHQVEPHPRQVLHHDRRHGVGRIRIAWTQRWRDFGTTRDGYVVGRNTAGVGLPIHRHLEIREGDVRGCNDRLDRRERCLGDKARVQLDQRLPGDRKRHLRWAWLRSTGETGSHGAGHTECSQGHVHFHSLVRFARSRPAKRIFMDEMRPRQRMSREPRGGGRGHPRTTGGERRDDQQRESDDRDGRRKSRRRTPAAWQPSATRRRTGTRISGGKLDEWLRDPGRGHGVNTGRFAAPAPS